LRWLFHLSSSPPYGILLRATSSSAVRTNSMWTGCNSRSRSTTFITACVDEVENHIIWNEKCIRNHKKHINTLTVPLIYWTSETTRCNVSSPYIGSRVRTPDACACAIRNVTGPNLQLHSGTGVTTSATRAPPKATCLRLVEMLGSLRVRQQASGRQRLTWPLPSYVC
jgi:hypothetical protein